MKYIISENRIMEIMDKFFNSEYPEIELPLFQRKSKGKVGGGYGSNEYTYVNYFYYSDNDHEDPLFIDWDDKHLFSNEKWSVNEKFKPMYDFFGESAFEDFIKWKFGIDITKRGNKKYNWRF